MTRADDSQVTIQNGVISFNGPDAVALFHASTLISAIRIFLATGMSVNRAYTRKNMLFTAANITQKAYPQSRRGLEMACDDLIIWRDNMASAIPVEVKR